MCGVLIEATCIIRSVHRNCAYALYCTMRTATRGQSINNCCIYFYYITRIVCAMQLPIALASSSCIASLLVNASERQLKAKAYLNFTYDWVFMVFISRWARRRTKEFRILTFISMSRSKAGTNNGLFNEELHSSPEIISGRLSPAVPSRPARAQC